MDRRQFLQSALWTSVLYGAGGVPGITHTARAAFEPVRENLLVNLFLSGGPDFRHLIVPAFDSRTDSFGYKYWSHRWRAHQIDNNPTAWQARWNNDYYHITVGGSNWNSSIQDISGGQNSGVTFGIWKHAGWLIDMFRAGNVAIVCNAVGGQNRAHDLASLQMHQGNILTGLNDRDHSGWGGRLARSAGGNAISITNTPLPFTFGPVGVAPNYLASRIDNRDLIAVQNSREIGLNEADLNEDQLYRPHDKMARALKHYYEGVRGEEIPQAYEKFRDHEQKVRLFGRQIRERLETVTLPPLIDALRNDISIGGQPVNPDPSNGEARRVLRSGNGFGSQIRNLYDVLASNDILNVRTVSMEYGGWDSHGEQRRNAANLDINNPDISRGIESGFRDIFGGQFGNSPSDSNALHAGFSALWASLSETDRPKMVLTVSGEFGRQIRDNGDAGTDHGKGNIMFIIGSGVTGGIYGEMFQDDEVDKYDDDSLRTPDIDPRTEFDSMFAQVSNWVASGSGQFVFPRTAAGYSGTAPSIEIPGMFNNLMS